MLLSHNVPKLAVPAAEQRASSDIEINFDQLLAAFRRRLSLILVCGLVGLIAAIGYVQTAIPQFTSFVHILIDNRQNSTVSEFSGAANYTYESAAVDSQLEILRSEKIVSAVVDQLNLTEDPEFIDPPVSIVGGIVSLAKSGVGAVLNFGEETLGIVGLSSLIEPEPLSPEDQAFQDRRHVVEHLQENLTASRLGLTYVLLLGYKSTDPRKSAQIANAFAEAYLTEQLDSKFDATQRASTWLQARIEELRRRSLETDLAVQRFRAEKGLIVAGGQLVNEQQLTELNSQLIRTRTDTAEAEAKYDRIRSILEAGDINATVTETLESDVINSLREQLADASKRESELSQTYGRNHVAAVRKRNEVEQFKQLIFQELDRVAQTYKSEVEIANSRLVSLEASMKELVGANALDNEQLVALRELEREAETYQNLYETFLQRYQEAIQQQSFPVTEARIITRAERPLDPSEPKKALIAALGLIGGLTIGAGLGMLREYQDRVFRRPDQVLDFLGVACVGVFPLVASNTLSKRSAKRADKKSRRIKEEGVELLGPAGDGPSADGTENGFSTFTIRDSSLRHVLDTPLGIGAETIRSARMAAESAAVGEELRTIGVVSSLPGEGKSTAASNMAMQIASTGRSVLLIDSDLRNPKLSRSLTPNTKPGLVEILSGKVTLEEVVQREEASGCYFLPVGMANRVAHTSELLSSQRMEEFVGSLHEHFNLVIFDLPPLGPVIDARALSRFIDQYLMVIEWGRTPRHVVREIAERNLAVWNKTAGIILNKVDMKKLQRYDEAGAGGYYGKSYDKYYTYS